MNSRPKVLLVGLNYRYINPTNALIPAALSRSFSTHFYGPGYVSQEVLERGIERYVESVGGVDLIFATKDFCTAQDPARLASFVASYAVMLNVGQPTAHTTSDVLRFLRRNRDRVIGLLTDLDPHSVPKAFLDTAEEHARFYVMWGKQFLNTLGDERWVAAERYMQKKLRAGQPLGLLDEFVASRDSSIISLGFFVGENEFYWGGVAGRPYDVCVPGSKYARREYFLKSLKGVRGLRIPMLGYKRAYQIADYLRARPFGNFYLLHLYNLFFQRTLSLSKCCVTDGGANNYPVRKFFEIPAAGAVLVCPPATGMRALGFFPHVNYVPVTDSADAIGAVSAIVREPERFETTASSGREQVYASHTLAARARQLDEAVRCILAGTFGGSTWEDGEFRCVTAQTERRLTASAVRANRPVAGR